MSTNPYLDAYWVVEGQLLAGAYPGDLEEERTRQKIRSLVNAGITTLIDLTHPGDTYHPYQQLLKEEAADFQIEMEWLNFPIADYDVPNAALMKQILDIIDQRLAAGKLVYVHCVGGIGRTGTTVGCYLVRHGLSGEEALLQLESLRRSAASWWRRSPESDQQIEFVLNWPTGE
jgi:predicted protein tyrosine phosphatase